jgi:hypothetical protein
MDKNKDKTSKSLLIDTDWYELNINKYPYKFNTKDNFDPGLKPNKRV